MLATLLLAAMSVDMLFGVTRVRIFPGSIRVRHGPFGIGPTRAAALHEIERIRVMPQVQYGSRTYCQIRIERRPPRPSQRVWGRHITAGSRIPNPSQAETLVTAMRDALGR